ncbi:MAG: hypothetical protein ABR875_01170 [Minisyncoccia bacterium]|jgi:hypothetical protein
MNYLVFFFFLHNVLATFVLGMKFVKRTSGVFKNFGIALLLDAVAFLVWLFGIMQQGSLLISVTIGAVVFLVSLVFMLRAAFEDTQASTRRLATIIGAIAVVGIFYVGHIQPETAYISQEGFFFFNLGPLMQMLYIFGLAFTALPAIDLLTDKFKSSYAVLVRYGFIAEVVTGIMLITSKNTQVLYISGWISGLMYLLLWTTLLFSRKAWASTS